MSKEEEVLYSKIVNMKRENELLTVIFEEVDELVKSGYDGQFIGEEVRGIFYAIKEYKQWRKDEIKS